MITTRFPVGFCPVCKRDVVLYQDLDETDQPVLCCIQCSSPPAPPEGARRVRVKRLNAKALADLGYDLGEEAAPALPEGSCKPENGLGGCSSNKKPNPLI